MPEIIPVTKLVSVIQRKLDSQTLLITDLGAIPPDYLDSKGIRPLRDKIKFAIMAGLSVPGCRLIEKGKPNVTK